MSIGQTDRHAMADRLLVPQQYWRLNLCRYLVFLLRHQNKYGALLCLQK